MTRRDLTRDALRKLRQARRLFDAAADHRAIADELGDEAARLFDEAKALEAGLVPLTKPRLVVP